MGFNQFVTDAQVFLLIFARIIALILAAPLTSSSSIPSLAKVGLALLSATLVFPGVSAAGYPIPENGLAFGLLLAGEAMVGLTMAFFLVIVYAIFQLAGQMFSLQMGFGASQVFDPLAQIEIPLMGQFLNIIAMFVFVTVSGFQRIFLIGVDRSFRVFRAVDLVLIREDIVFEVMGRLGLLFEQALIISFPVLGTLVLVYVAMGLIAKAAPQMNLLILGFPISIGVTFLVIFVALPFVVESFDRVIEEGFSILLRVFANPEALR